MFSAEETLRRAVQLHQQGALDQAKALYESVLILQPKQADALHLLGVIAAQRRDYAKSLELIDRAIALDRRQAAFHSNRATALQGLQRFAEALRSAETALTLQPEYPDALVNRGRALGDLGQSAEALACYEHALRLQPSLAKAHNNRGNLLKDLGNFSEAMRCYTKAYELSPSFQDAATNKGLLHLLFGEYSMGWSLYENRRFNEGVVQVFDRGFVQSEWRGEDLGGKRILLVSEQGFGDVLQFCRYAKRVAERGGEVVLEAPRPLLPILSGLQGVSTLVARGEPLPPFDYYCPLLSLPRIFGTRLETIPAPGKYLSSDPERVALWRERLGPSSRARVGIAWGGNAKFKKDRERSIALSVFQSCLSAEYEYISLQTEIRESDREAFAGSGIRHFGEELRDFGDTAALCELCERVISVDTSVVHLNAALGRPTWVLLPQVPDWRWLLAREDSPWYPTVRLFRQGPERTWQGVLARVGAALAED